MVRSMSSFQDFVTKHQDQLLACEIPQHFWKTLFEKLKFEIFDADEAFDVVKEVEAVAGTPGLRSSCVVLVSNNDGLKIENGENIFLIDHVWTFSLEDARDQLSGIPGLADRLAAIVGVEQCPPADKADLVMEEIWKYCHYCSVPDPQTGLPVPIWYVWDEFGSSLSHGRDTVRIRPFYYVETQTTYSVMWPITDLRRGDRVTRDCVVGNVEGDVRRARAVPWTKEDMTSDDYLNLSDSHFTAGESVPAEGSVVLPGDRPLRVYTDLDLVKSFLTDKRYTIVDDLAAADIVWVSYHIKDFRNHCNQYPHHWFNQFPGEYVFTAKDLLALTCRSQEDKSRTPWLPTTYLLQEELAQFVSHYQKRQKSGENNIWICKPWNLCRGRDIHITDNLNYLIRLAETPPKVACKYVNDPVLYRLADVGSVKFDVRYVVYLTSVQPLVLHVNKVFWLRFANEPFSLDDFHNYQKHFTVMNYEDGGKKLRQVHSDEFIIEFNKQFPDFPWEGVESSILSALKSLFERSSSKPFPRGLHPLSQSRAIYAADVMLSWLRDENGRQLGIQPQICEVNFSPDTVRACKYHPHFYNQAFNLLFRGQDDGGFHVL